MKKIILGLALIAGIFSACSEDKLDLYSGQNYLQFVRPMTDSTNVSFLLFPGETTHKLGLPVYLIGKPAEIDREYSCEVMLTGADDDAPKEAYTLPQKFIFRANMTTDTLWVDCNLLPEMSERDYRLILVLKESENFGLGANGYLGAIIRISNIISRPAWWTTSYPTTAFLGPYSDAKYREFIKATGVADFDSDDFGLLREYTNTFKRYLERMKAAGTPVLEDDGTEMTVKMVF
jgi:hypothetical protein